MAHTNLKNFRELFIHELQHIYSAEKQLIDALPKMAKAATDDKLKKAFMHHLDETKKQKERLDRVADKLGESLDGTTCKGMKGLIEEGEGIVKADSEGEIKDAGLIAAAQKVEHYEIASYGTAINWADNLGEDEVADLLSENLEEEKKADSKLNRIATKSINKKAERAS